MRIDYDRISTRYDNHRRGGGPYLRKLVELAMACDARRVLEIGAGTGLNTQAFLSAHPCQLVALEPSSGMLRKAREKAIPAHWLQGSGLSLPLSEGGISFVFGVYVLHHLSELDKLFHECARVLQDGCAAFVTASADFIQRHPMNHYFPSFAEVDKTRFQPIPAIEEGFRRAGFSEVGLEQFVDAPRPIDSAYVDRVANRFISTYDLIPPDEFEEGVRRLRADVAQTGRLDVDMEWESVAIWAWK